MTLGSRRVLSLAGTILAADGVTFATNPEGQIDLWSGRRAPSWYRRTMSFFGRHLTLCRALAAVEFLAGVAMLHRAARAE